MILSPEVDGQRAQAEKAFGKLDTLLQKSLLANSVLLLSTDNAFHGSALLFYADDAAAYVLSAKHNLYVQAGRQADYRTTSPSKLAGGFMAAVRMYYGPTALGNQPTRDAKISAITYDGGADDWQYDVMLLASTDTAFRDFVAKNALIKNQKGAQSVLDLMKDKGKTGIPILDKAKFRHVQLGFGHGTDPDVVVTRNWPTHPGQAQCRFPYPEYKTASEVRNLDLDKPSTWKDAPKLSAVVLMSGQDTNSTGAGDSGGPVFALSPQTKPSTAYLVATTLGANFYLNPAPTPPPVSSKIDNTAATFLRDVLKARFKSIPNS
jgi:hypothetical protein